MDDKKLDHLLQAHFSQPTPVGDFQQLQQKVLRGIESRKRPSVLIRLLEKFTFDGELRAGPAFAAMVVGIGVGYATFDLPNTGRNFTDSSLGFGIFSSVSTHLLVKANL